VFSLLEHTVTSRDHIRDPEVDANRTACRLKRDRWHGDALHVQSPLRAFAPDGDRLWFAQAWSVIVGFDLTDSFQIQSLVLCLHLPAARVEPLK